MCVRCIASSLSPVVSTAAVAAAAAAAAAAGGRATRVSVSSSWSVSPLEWMSARSMTFSSSLDVARPHVLLQREHRGLRHCRDPAPELPLALMDEKPHERRDVVPPFAERRQVDWIHAQAVVQVRSEEAGCDIRLQVSMSRGNHAHIHAFGSRIRLAEFSFLQDAQQLDLNLRQQIADLVQEDCPAIGQFETPQPRRCRAGERSLFMTEQLALDERRRQRGAVDADQRLGAAPATVV